MKTSLIYLFLLVFSITNCSNNQDPKRLLNSDTIRVNDNLFLNAPDDTYQITEVNIVGNTLNITITYGGGCGNINYDLFAPTGYDDSLPLQKDVRLAFEDRDNCEALVELELSFNIEQIQVEGTNQIRINLTGWETPIDYSY